MPSLSSRPFVPMRVPALVVVLVPAVFLALASAAREARAGACTSQVCTCDSDCSGLLCSSDPSFSPGRCCGLPVTLGTPCAGSGGRGGSPGTGGRAATDAGGTGGAGGGGGDGDGSGDGCSCALVGAEGVGGAALAAWAAGLAAVTIVRPRSSGRRRGRRSCRRTP